MKKIIATAAIMLCFGAVFSLSLPAEAQFVAEPSNKQAGNNNTFEQFISVINFVFAVAFLFSIVGLIISAVKYVIAGGSEKVIGSANATLIASLTGMGVSLIGYVIVQVIRYYIR